MSRKLTPEQVEKAQLTYRVILEAAEKGDESSRKFLEEMNKSPEKKQREDRSKLAKEEEERKNLERQIFRNRSIVSIAATIAAIFAAYRYFTKTSEEKVGLQNPEATPLLSKNLTPPRSRL